MSEHDYHEERPAPPPHELIDDMLAGGSRAEIIDAVSFPLPGQTPSWDG